MTEHSPLGKRLIEGAEDILAWQRGERAVPTRRSPASVAAPALVGEVGLPVSVGGAEGAETTVQPLADVQAFVVRSAREDRAGDVAALLRQAADAIEANKLTVVSLALEHEGAARPGANLLVFFDRSR